VTLDPHRPFQRDPLAVHLMRDRLTRSSGENMGLGLGMREFVRSISA
jgi:hypothetical protein